MKLLVILTVIAIGYADKLDRTYLPPSNAASAGGSPGDLTAPAIQSGPSFGQGLSPGLGSTPRPAGFTQRPPVFSQGSAGVAQGPSGFGQGPSGVAQGPSGFGQGPSGVAQGPSGFGQGPFGVAQGPSGFGQGPSGVAQGPSGFGQRPSGFGQGPSGVAQGPSGFGQGPSGVAQGPSGFSQGPSIFGQGPSGFSQGPSTFSKGPSIVSQGSSSLGQGPSKSELPSNGLDLSNKGVPSGNGFVPTKTGATPGSSYDAAFETRVPSAPLGFGSSQLGANQAGVSQLANGPFNQGFGQGPFGPTGPQAYTPERAQASADRSATILNYYNENNGDSYKYNYETSNGISAGEEGVATNGVRAQGGYSYIGDDGVSYSVTYTADENGFQPRGDHLPTPPPIPEEILKSIEENARAAAAGTQEGAYRPEEYESEAPLGQYNAGAANFNQPQGPNVGAVQGPQSAQGQFSRPESNQFPGSLNQFTQSPIGISGQYGQQSAGSLGQFNEKASAGLGQTIQSQGQGTNGYNYKQPQSNFEPTGFGQRPSSQFRPQPNAPEQKDFSVNIGSNKPGFNNQGPTPTTSGITGVSSLGGSQSQYQTGFGQSNTLSGNKVDTQFNGNQPAFGSNIGSNQGASQFGEGNQASGSGVSATAGVRDSQPIQAPYQYNRPSQGFDSQPQRPGFNGPQSSTPVSQGIQRGPDQFGGPRQPPSFSPEQGYKY